MESKELCELVEQQFDIEKYDAVRWFGVCGWCNELYYRSLLFDGFGKPSGSVLNGLQEAADRLLEQPLLEVNDDFIFGESDTGSVCEISIFDVFEYESMLVDDLPGIRKIFEQAEEESALEENVPEALATSFNSHSLQHHDTAYFNRVVPVKVNLEATDEQIMSELSELLKRKRSEFAEYGIGEAQYCRFGEKDFRLWERWKILAYLDLLFLEQFYIAKIPNHQKGRLLFPHESGVDMSERIRKVVKPLAEKLIASDTVGALAWAALRSVDSNRNEDE